MIYKNVVGCPSEMKRRLFKLLGSFDRLDCQRCLWEMGWSLPLLTHQRADFDLYFSVG